MRVSNHIKTSGVLGLGVYAYTGEFVPAAACFLSGWLIDVDHFLDWWMSFGPTLQYTRVLNNFSRSRLRRFYVVFHAWEYVIGLLAVYLLYGLPQWAVYAALGYTCHLTLDQIFNGPKRPFAYFITYRALHNFNSFFLVRGSKFAPVFAKKQVAQTDGH